MQYKTDLKEKFTVLTFLDTKMTSNLVPEIEALTQEILGKPPKNLVVNCQHITQWDPEVIEGFVHAQQQFYDNNASFVICSLSKSLQDSLDNSNFAQIMNTTPTESEAWDIVQMEEIERELLDSDDMEFANPE
ncbi:MAG: STAS domain-containing protein [Chitinophagia bacterium]|jgi:anti-anti-sigma regulatory factor|nr:STAS domain-containing protein [Chitinophagia bacterium]